MEKVTKRIPQKEKSRNLLSRFKNFINVATKYNAVYANKGRSLLISEKKETNAPKKE